jgi:hypothetical protein
MYKAFAPAQSKKKETPLGALSSRLGVKSIFNTDKSNGLKTQKLHGK